MFKMDGLRLIAVRGKHFLELLYIIGEDVSVGDLSISHQYVTEHPRTVAILRSCSSLGVPNRPNRMNASTAQLINHLSIQ